jgi:hypothetical protein
MTAREIVTLSFLFVLYLLLQLLLVRNVVLFDSAFCFVYVACILLLPYETAGPLLLLTAFVVGVVVDTFYNTLGVHAAASVLMAYVRPAVVRSQVDMNGPEARVVFSLDGMGIAGFFRYILTMVLIHHAALFLIEAGSLTLIVPTLLRIGASALFTSVSIVLIQFFTRN